MLTPSKNSNSALIYDISMQGKKGKATVNSAFAPLVADVNLVHEAGVKVADRLEAKLKVTFLCQTRRLE